MLWHVLTLFLVVNDGGLFPKIEGVPGECFYCCFLMSVFENASLNVMLSKG
jgi:hypothetical protein